jgi:dienelactone hydrolase
MKFHLCFLISLCASSACATSIALDGTSQPRVSIYKTYTVDTKAPTVIVSHGSAGVDAPPVRMAIKIQGWGYNSIVVDHYSTKGIASGAHNVGTVVEGAKGPERALDVIAVARWVKKQPWHQGKIVVIGYSQGGGTVNALADQNKMETLYPAIVTKADYELFAGGIGMYPSCGHKLDASPPASYSAFPVQLHLGTDDDLARPDWCQTFAVGYELIYYKGATHLFDITAGNTKFTHRYSSEAYELSTQRIRSFLDKHLKLD